MYKDKRVIDWLTEELYAHKKDKQEIDGKLCMISKDQVKNAIGRSPDFADAFCIKRWLDLSQNGRVISSAKRI
jgi:hypothetical protein